MPFKWGINLKLLMNNVPMVVFPALQKTEHVSHGISTRMGGVSTDAWASLNLQLRRGDSETNVVENFSRFTAALGIPLANTVFSAQTHSTNVRRVFDSDRGKGIGPSDIECTDGLHTNEPNTALVTFCADCVPILFFDPNKKVIAAAHSGWRGTVAEIGRIMVETLVKEYGCEPGDILAGIGPSVGPCCFEVDPPVTSEFLEKPNWANYIKEPDSSGKSKIDLWQINKQILIDAGLLPEHIDCEPICTCCNEKLFYSQRRDGDKRGAMATVICLKT